MSGSAVVAMQTAELSAWRVVGVGQAPAGRPRSWALPGAVFLLGVTVTGAAATALWAANTPATIVQTRIHADGPGDTARQTLSDVALRLSGAADRPLALADGGDTLVVTERDGDPAEARKRTRALVDTVLNLSLAAPGLVAQPAVTPGGALQAERTRLAAAVDAAQNRTAAISASLTDLARDIASRGAADRRPGRETLDKGNAALADLQLQRLQLASKYQDTYPAVIALDGQIRNLRVFLMDEARRIEVKPAADPADATLVRERERLRAELIQVEDRRKAAASELDGVERKLAAAPAAAAPVLAAVVPPTVLVAAATTSFTAPDTRPGTMQMLAAFGLILSSLGALLVRSRRVTGGLNGLMLERLVAHDPGAALPHVAQLPLAGGLPWQAARPSNWSRAA